MGEWLPDDPMVGATVILAATTFILAIATVLMAAWTRRSASATEKSALAALESLESSRQQLALLKEQHHIAFTPATLSLRILVMDLDLYPKPKELEHLSHTEIWKELSDNGEDPTQILDYLTRQLIYNDTSTDAGQLQSEANVLDRFKASSYSRTPATRFVLLVGNPTKHAALGMIAAIYDPRHCEFAVCTYNYDYLGSGDWAYFPMQGRINTDTLVSVLAQGLGQPSQETTSLLKAINDWTVIVCFRIASGRSFLMSRRYSLTTTSNQFTIEPLDYLTLRPFGD